VAQFRRVRPGYLCPPATRCPTLASLFARAACTQLQKAGVFFPAALRDPVPSARTCGRHPSPNRKSRGTEKGSPSQYCAFSRADSRGLAREGRTWSPWWPTASSSRLWEPSKRLRIHRLALRADAGVAPTPAGDPALPARLPDSEANEHPQAEPSTPSSAPAASPTSPARAAITLIEVTVQIPLCWHGLGVYSALTRREDAAHRPATGPGACGHSNQGSGSRWCARSGPPGRRGRSTSTVRIIAAGQ